MVTPGLDNLHIMTCGTIAPNPAELVSTRTNTDFLRESREEYDFVIIDAPPVLAATDAAIWATKADGVILVYHVGKVARGALRRTKAQIDNVKARVLGVVLNGLKADVSPDFEYHDKYYYYSSGETKRKPTLREMTISRLEGIKQYVSKIPEKLKNFVKDVKNNEKLNRDLKSRVINILLLLLALALLIAGLYFERTVTKPVQVPAMQGTAAQKGLQK